jgi:hypothetical protein
VKWNRGHADRRRPAPTGRDGSDPADVDEGTLDCSLEELREFLEADLIDVPVDLEFKERLRRKLWDLVQVRNRLRGRNPDGH